MTEGENGDLFYMIVDGEVVISNHGLELGSLRSGEYFGELALL